jgi:hypothetical protein
MTDDLKSAFSRHHSDKSFIKSTDNPVLTLTSAQKVQLNRKGNEFFNQGKFNEALRLFITTGYSDGLRRCGDNYMKKGNELEALKLYWLAHDKTNIEPIITKIAGILSIWAQEAEEE